MDRFDETDHMGGFVIPGRHRKVANSESIALGQWLWVPGFAAWRRPGTAACDSKLKSMNTRAIGEFLMEGVTIVRHPLVQHKLTLLRDRSRSTKSFRELCRELGILMCYEVTRDLPLGLVEIDTPIARMMAPRIAGKKLVFAPILRAGMAFVEGMLELVPSARVAHIGLYRDPDTLVAVEYFFKAPVDVAERLVVVVAPVIATANTAVAAVDRLKERGARDIRYVCLITVPTALERLRGIHPDVLVWTAAIDERLDDDAFIVPGLGDAGDRAYGTR